MEDNKKPKKAAATSETPIQGMPPLNTEQLEYLMKMIENSKAEETKASGFSLYDMRDPRTIQTVNVKRFAGNDGATKFVVAFKDFQNDKFKKTPKYTVMQFDPVTGKNSQPFVTLILSDGSEDENGKLITEEKEVRLIDYVEYRERFDAKVLNTEKRSVVKSFGILGGHAMASEVDAKGMKVSYPNVNKETKEDVMIFHVELPGFSKPVEFLNDPVGPLA